MYVCIRVYEYCTSPSKLAMLLVADVLTMPVEYQKKISREERCGLNLENESRLGCYTYDTGTSESGGMFARIVRPSSVPNRRDDETTPISKKKVVSENNTSRKRFFLSAFFAR